MDLILVILLIILIIGIAAILFVLQKNNSSKNTSPDIESQRLMLDVIENLRKEIQDGNGKNRQELQQRLDVITEQVQKNLHFSSKTIQDQFLQTSSVIKDVTHRLTKLDETNQQVLSFSKQMQSLENILKNPKHRGVLGEYFLENMLSHVLQPQQYQMQYKFKNGEIVDAVVFYRDQVIPIDSKFSLEKYNRLMESVDAAERIVLEKEFKADLKNRIDETAKYVRPQEGTTDFAFMFIPAEGIYYNLLIYKVGTLDVNAQDLREYAQRKKVIIASPTTFFAYLQTVLQGLKGAQTEQNIQHILKRIQDLSRHLESYQAYFTRLGNNLGTTVNAYNSAAKEFGKIDKDVVKLTDGEAGGKISIEQLDKPQE